MEALKRSLPGRSAAVPLVEYARLKRQRGDPDADSFVIALAPRLSFLLLLRGLFKFDAQTAYRCDKGWDGQRSVAQAWVPCAFAPCLALLLLGRQHQAGNQPYPLLQGSIDTAHCARRWGRAGFGRRGSAGAGRGPLGPLCSLGITGQC